MFATHLDTNEHIDPSFYVYCRHIESHPTALSHYNHFMHKTECVCYHTVKEELVMIATIIAAGNFDANLVVVMPSAQVFSKQVPC